MKTFLRTGILALALLWTGCATSFNLTPVVERDQRHDLVWVQGHGAAVSMGDSTTVALFGMKTGGDEILLHLLFVNRSGTRHDVMPDWIEVFSTSSLDVPYSSFGRERHAGERYELTVYDPDRYMKSIQNAQRWALAFQALGGAVNSISAGYSSSSTTGSVSTTNGYGSFQATTQTYDPSKQLAAQSQSDQDIARTRSQFESNNTLTENGLLKRNTLYPGQSIEGNVMVQWEEADHYEIKVTFGGEVHRFTLISDVKK